MQDCKVCVLRLYFLLKTKNPLRLLAEHLLFPGNLIHKVISLSLSIATKNNFYYLF